MTKRKKKFFIYSEFPEYIDGDPEFGKQDFFGDPWGYTVEYRGDILAEFGDDYHDKGLDKSEGFIEGYVKAKGILEDEYTIEYEHRVSHEVV